MNAPVRMTGAFSLTLRGFSIGLLVASAFGRYKKPYRKEGVSMLVAQSGLLNTMLTELTAASATLAGILNGVKIGLFTNRPTITPNLLLSALTAPVTTGLAALSSAVVWGTVYNSETGFPAENSDLKAFISSGTITPETINGYYLVAGSGSPTVPLAVELFAAGIGILNVGDGFNLSVTFSLPNSTIGQGVVID